MTAEEVEHADEDQSYEWVLTSKAYGEWCQEYAEALVRNAHEKAIHRIEPQAERNKVIRWMEEEYPALAAAYNMRAPKGFKI